MNRFPIIATVVAGLLIAGLPPAVAAAAPQTGSTATQCAQWGFNGPTDLTQPPGDSGDPMGLYFSATGANVNGDVEVLGPGFNAAGTLNGFIRGNDVELSVRADQDVQGVLRGKVDDTGQLSVSGRLGPLQNLPWTSKGALKCMQPGQ